MILLHLDGKHPAATAPSLICMKVWLLMDKSKELSSGRKFGEIIFVI